MSEAYFYLGKGRDDQPNLSTKARLLDQAASSRLKVPLSVVVRDEALSIALLRGLVQQHSDGTITCDKPEKLVTWLDLPTFGRLVAVRAAFSAQRQADAAIEDSFDTVLKINANDAHDVSEALCQVWSSTADHEREFRRDVILMQMVDANYAGVAMVEPDYADDLIRYTKGLGMDVIAGMAAGQTLLIPRRWRSEITASSRLPDWAKRLQTLLKNVRRVVGNEAWRIKFADDGKQCYLLQIQPLKHSPPRNEVFTHTSFRETLPDVPSPFMTDVIQSCADDLYDYFRQFDPRLPAHRSLVDVIKGRPYMNLSLLTDTVRRCGIPTGGVLDDLGSVQDLRDRMRWRRMLIKTVQGVLPSFIAAQTMATRRAQQTEQQLHERMKTIGETLPDLAETLRQVYIMQQRTLVSLNITLRPLLRFLRIAGTLEEHSRRQETITTTMYYDQRLMRDYAQRDDNIRTAMQRGELPEDDYFGHLWDYYVERYGHRGAYEQDIAQPRYHDDPSALLKSLAHPYRLHRDPDWTLRGRLTAPVWWLAKRLIQTRENWQHTVLKAYDDLRQAMLSRAANYVERGVLESAQQIWQLRLDEWQQLDDGWQPDADFITEREAELATYRDYDLPDVVRRFDDLDRYYQRDISAPRRQRMQGISLTDDQITGKVWVLDAPSTDLPEGFSPESTILIARSVDAGWIPTFGLVAGVAVETGSDMSSGSVVLREIGLPAITQVGSVTQVFQTGDTVILRAGRGVIERVETTSDDADADETIDAVVTV